MKNVHVHVCTELVQYMYILHLLTLPHLSQFNFTVFGVITEPGQHTTIVSLYGGSGVPFEWTVVTVDFASIFPRECEDDDYYDWKPWDVVRCTYMYSGTLDVLGWIILSIIERLSSFRGKNVLPLYRLVHWKVSFVQRCPLFRGSTVYTVGWV